MSKLIRIDGRQFVNPDEVSALDNWVEYVGWYYDEESIRGTVIVLKSKDRIYVKNKSPKECADILKGEA